MNALKGMLKKVLLVLVQYCPGKYWSHIREQFMRSPRKSDKASMVIERVLNDLNRGIVINECLRSGVVYFNHNHNIPQRYIYEHIFNHYAKNPIDYLEFGVGDGGSIRVALSQLSPLCNLYGFDSFEGLPEHWFQGFPKGDYGRAGIVPDIHAPNLRFIKGWFKESLVPFLTSTPLKSNLILLMDADLYSSTIYVLRTMKNYLTPGTILIFDEYWFLQDEFRALSEFVTETGKTFEYLAVSDASAAIRFTT